jgi:hypothetical protein
MLAYLLVALVLAIAMTGAFALRRGGVLYPLDDSYIHLALGRTLAESGVWGVTSERASAASSSPLWTVLLAAAAKVTPGLGRAAFSWAPLLGNLLAGALLIGFWRRRLASAPLPNLAALVLIAIVPLPVTALIGMEHVLHALMGCVLAWYAACALEHDERPGSRQVAKIAALSALAVATRYETMAMVATIAGLAAVYRRWSLIPGVLIPPLLTMAAFGAIWVRNGGWWVPNSFLLKTGAGEKGGVLANLYDHVIEQAFSVVGLMTAFLLASLAIMWLAVRSRRGPERVLLVLGAACTAAQFLFGQLGWLHRYEAWLVALDGFAVVMAASAVAQGRARVFGAIVLVFLAFCLPRTGLALSKTVLAAHDREWEHFGPADALAPLGGVPLLVNDIGVFAYYGPVRPVDVFGLADNESLRLKREERFEADDVRAFARSVGARHAELQICWDKIRMRLPTGWSLVEAWTGQRNVVFRDLTVAFLAQDDTSSRELHAALAKAQMPAGVRRFDAASPLVRAFNADPDKNQASIELCRQAAIIVTGKPDPTVPAQ